MTQGEKSRLLDLLEDQGKWCREAEARDADGQAVHFDDNAAVAWDITGALCKLFGWQRACALFVQIDRHIHGKRVVMSWPTRDIEMDAMGALQEFNDKIDMTFATLRERIESMPIWHGNNSGVGDTPSNESTANTWT